MAWRRAPVAVAEMIDPAGGWFELDEAAARTVAELQAALAASKPPVWLRVKQEGGRPFYVRAASVVAMAER